MSPPLLGTPAQRSWKLPSRATPVVFAFFMSSIMAFLMSLVITAANTGVGPGYLSATLKAYQLAMPVAFVCVMLVRPIVIWLVKVTVRT
jgi:hypothetical protein